MPADLRSLSVLLIVSLDSSINGFLGRDSVGNGVEFRWLARASGLAPVDHVAVIPAVRVERQAAKLPTIRLYDLRHTAATLMLAAGVNAKVASERLGHSTIVLTMDTYSHVLPDMQQDAVDRVDRLLANASA
jgi:integrase